MLDFVFIEDIEVDVAMLVPKRWDAATTISGLREATGIIEAGGETGFEPDQLEARLRALCEERGWKVGDLFMPIRVAITGRTATPPLFDTMVAIGYGTTVNRLLEASSRLEQDTRERIDAPDPR